MVIQAEKSFGQNLIIEKDGASVIQYDGVN
jgi:hypothetical protein